MQGKGTDARSYKMVSNWKKLGYWGCNDIWLKSAYKESSNSTGLKYADSVGPDNAALMSDYEYVQADLELHCQHN